MSISNLLRPGGEHLVTFHYKMKLDKYMNTGMFTLEIVYMNTDIYSRICTNPLNANYIIYRTKLLMQCILGYETRNLGLWALHHSATTLNSTGILKSNTSIARIIL